MPSYLNPPINRIIKNKGSVQRSMFFISLYNARPDPEYSTKGPPTISVSASGISKGTNANFACIHIIATISAIPPDQYPVITPLCAW